jgi:hypothetical protein
MVRQDFSAVSLWDVFSFSLLCAGTAGAAPRSGKEKSPVQNAGAFAAFASVYAYKKTQPERRAANSYNFKKPGRRAYGRCRLRLRTQVA